jgi:hypothetical protein
MRNETREHDNLHRQNVDVDPFALHDECLNRARSAIISQYMKLHPEALEIADDSGCLPLHNLLMNESSTVDDALMMIDKYPLALRRKSLYNELPIDIECRTQCRASILSKCIELYPQSLDAEAILVVMYNVDKSNFHSYLEVLSIIFAARPMSLYDRQTYVPDEILDNPYYRRRILHLLPRNVFTPTHESDFHDLNWTPRAAMILLLSQIRNLQVSSYKNAELQLGILQDDDASGNGQLCLLLRIIKASTLLGTDMGRRAVGMISEASYGIHLHEDLGDILLRSILGFL